MTGGRTRGSRWEEVGERALGATEVARSRVEDGIIFGKARSQATQVRKGALVRLRGLEDRAGERGRCRGLLGSGRLSVWFSIAKAATAEEISQTDCSCRSTKAVGDGKGRVAAQLCSAKHTWGGGGARS